MNRTKISILVAPLLFLAGCAEEQQAETKPAVIRPVISTVVADVDTIRLSTYPGRAKALKELNLGFEVSGKLLSRPAEVGLAVKTGDVLATLDADPFKARIRALEGQKAALIASLEDARKDLERNRELLKKSFASQARVDDLIALVKSTEANIEAINGALDEARLHLKYTSLVAPFDGTISETFVDNFQNITARQPVARLFDTSRIEMEVSVPENFINMVSFVDTIEVTFSSLPGVAVPATIARVGNEASTTTRTYPVTIVMDQPEGQKIQPGMAGRVTARVKLPEDLDLVGIQVPLTALFSPNTSDPDQKHIWVIDPETKSVKSKPVDVRSFNQRGAFVRGLAVGDRIVTAGANSLVEGQEVRLMDGVE